MTESLSETTKVAVGKEVSSLDVSPQFDAYSGVEIIVSDESSYFAGNRNGRVLTIENPWGSQAQATAILNSLQAKGFQYQPYTADGAILNPAAEIGDGITISDTYSGIYKISRNYTPLMAADLEAPQDEEVDHEYPYEPKQDRIYKREIAEANAQISINAQAISSEVTNRTKADNNLNTTLTSKINQTATNINATVTEVSNNKLDHTRTNTSFGWDLTATAFKINASGNKNVFTCNSSGITIQGNATVTGKIQATSGYIGSGTTDGFTITSKAIYNGKSALTNASNGVYIGKDGIALGASNAFSVTSNGKLTAKNVEITGGTIQIKDSNGNVAFRVTSTGGVTATNLALNGGSIKLGSNFSVTSTGNVTANNMTLKGTLTVGGATITADSLRQGAERANNGYSSWNAAATSTSSGGYCYTGAGYGVAYNKATINGSGAYPSYFKALSLYCNNLYSGGDVYATKSGGYLGLTSHSHNVSVSGGTVTIGSASSQAGSFNIADTQFYRDGVAAAASGVYVYRSRLYESGRSGNYVYVKAQITLSNGNVGYTGYMYIPVD